MSWCRGWMAGAQSRNGQLLYTVWLKCPASRLLKALEKVTLCNGAVFSSLEGCEGISARMNCGSGEAFEPPPTITCAVTTCYRHSPRLSNQSEVLLPRLWTIMHNTFGWIGIFQFLIIYLQRCVAISFRTLFLFSQNIAVSVIHILDAITVMQCASGYPLPPGSVFQRLKKTVEVWDMSRGLLPSTPTLQSSSATLWAKKAKKFY